MITFGEPCSRVWLMSRVIFLVWFCMIGFLWGLPDWKCFWGGLWAAGGGRWITVGGSSSWSDTFIGNDTSVMSDPAGLRGLSMSYVFWSSLLSSSKLVIWLKFVTEVCSGGLSESGWNPTSSVSHSSSKLSSPFSTKMFSEEPNCNVFGI